MKKNYMLQAKSMILLHLMFLALNANTQTEYLSFNDGRIKHTDQLAEPQRFIDNKNQVIYYSFEFDGAVINEIKVKDDDYQYLQMIGFSLLAEVGKPALPADMEMVAAPIGAKIIVEIDDAEYVEYSGFRIHPALKPATDTKGDPEPEFEIDENFYKKNQFYPENIVELADMHKIRGIGLGLIRMCPVQYNPATGMLRVYKKIQYKVRFVGGEGSFASVGITNSNQFTHMIKNMVANPEFIPDGIDRNASPNKTGSKDYIIVTHSQFLNAANNLAEWKRQLGYSVEVVSQSSWTASQVKTEIANRYNSWTPKPDYFVIIGDHTGSYSVPGEEHLAPDASQYFATDLYYACMDGAGDFVPDMSKGRISVQTSTYANSVVQKIIDYEKNPIDDVTFYGTGLNCAQYQDDDNDGYAERRFCHSSEDVRDYMINNQGYNVNRVYYTESTAPLASRRYNNTYYSTGGLLPAELRDASFDWSGGASDIDSEIEAGRFYVLHRDHGYVGGSGWAAPYFTTTSLGSLNNGNKRPVVFSINCHTGEFYQTECFAEKFMNISGGAVGVVAAACYSYSGHNDAFIAGAFNAIWSNPGLQFTFGSGGVSSPPSPPSLNDKHMGNVVNYALARMMDTWAYWQDEFEYTHRLFHWFGDPAMRIWTTNPNSTVITATHESTFDTLSTAFQVTGSTPGALATIVYDGELIGEVVLNGSGEGTINYTSSGNASTATLTVSKEDCKPYIATLTVVGAGTFPEPTNLQATIAGTNVDLIWNAPPQGPTAPNYGTPEWYAYTQMGEVTNLNWPTPERGTLFDVGDFTYTYPAQISKISHGFYEHSTYPWPDATFHFKIYNSDGSTLLYESGDIEAVHNTEIEHTLTEPLEVTDNFYVVVVPVDASGHPSSLSKEVATGTTHSYSGSAGSWTIYDNGTDAFEFMTRVYLAVPVKGEVVISSINETNANNDTKFGIIDSKSVSKVQFHGANKDYQIIKNNEKSTLSGYKIYRTGTSAATYIINDPNDTTYTDGSLGNGVYNYCVTAIYTSPDGESDTSNNVEVTIGTITATASNNGPVCEGDDLQLSSTPDGFTSYTWSGPDGFTSDEQNPLILGISLSGAGDYTVTMTDGGGNSYIATTAAVINAKPDAIAANDGPACEGENIQLTSTPNSMLSYNWTGPNGFSSSEQNPILTSVEVADAGDYSVVIENSDGCTDQTMTTVNVNETPTAVAANDGPACVGEDVALSGAPNGMSSYEWTGPDSYTASTQNPVISGITLSSAGEYTLIVTSNENCEDSDVTTVVVNENPDVTASNNGPVYVGEDLQLNSLPDGLASYAWEGPNSFVSSEQNPLIESIAIDEAGIYEVTAVSSDGCQGNATTEVTVNMLPTYTVTFIVSDSENSNLIEGASVNINSEVLTTDVNGESQIELEDGEYNYDVTAEGYLSYANTVNVSGANLTENIVLTPDGIYLISNSSIKIYPNPAKESLTVNLNTQLQSFAIKMYNSFGNLVIFKEVDNNQKTIIELNLQDIPAGIYNLMIQSKDMQHIEKIIVE